MVGDLKTTEIEYSLRFAPFDRWFERRRSRQEGVPGVDQKARGPEPKTGRGQSFQSAAHLFREPSYQTVTSTIRQQRPCSRGSSQDVSAMMSEFSLDAKLAELMSTARFRSR